MISVQGRYRCAVAWPFPQKPIFQKKVRQMTANATATIDPQTAWLERAQSSLQESCNCQFHLWIPNKELGWQLAEVEKTEDSFNDSSTNQENVDQVILENLLHQAQDEGIPSVHQITAQLVLLAIPLQGQFSSENLVATRVFITDMPEHLLAMAQVSQRCFKQESQIASLKQENEFFLHQVSEDFENLTFLGFMAERLSLGDGTTPIDDTLNQSLLRLGETIKTQTLCFIDGQDASGPKVKAIWNTEGKEAEAVDTDLLLKLVEHYREDVKFQPVIKNALPDSSLLPGVRDFILVEVSTSISDIGWLLAVNRDQICPTVANQSSWRLSQYEFGTNEASLLSTAASMLASHVSNLNLFQERETLLVNVVRALVSAVEAKDVYTCGHSERVALFAKRLAEQIGYTDEDCQLLYLTGLLHDVGKIAVSDAVLNKADALTEEEFDEIKKHPDEGWAILRELKQLSYVLPGVLHHHERYDGRGYPDGLAGEDIPLDGRVLAVADAFDAMTSNRAYRQGMPQQKAEEILRAGSGSQWDEKVIEAFFEVNHEITEIRENYQSRQRPVRIPYNQPQAR